MFRILEGLTVQRPSPSLGAGINAYSSGEYVLDMQLSDNQFIMSCLLEHKISFS